MGEFRSYQDLEVWQRAMVLTKSVYHSTNHFPADEKFGLTSQMRRAAVSIPSNLAEGHARSGSAEFLRFVSITLGSLAELETQILLATELDFLSTTHRDSLLAETGTLGRMIRGLQKTLKIRRSHET